MIEEGTGRRWNGDNEDELQEFTGGAIERVMEDSLGSGEKVAYLRTQAGLVKLAEGDYVVQSTEGLTRWSAKAMEAAAKMHAVAEDE